MYCEADRGKERYRNFLWPVEYSIKVFDPQIRLKLSGLSYQSYFRIEFESNQGKPKAVIYNLRGDKLITEMPIVRSEIKMNESNQGDWKPYWDYGIVAQFKDINLRIPLFITRQNRFWPQPPGPIKRNGIYSIEVNSGKTKNVFPILTYFIARSINKQVSTDFKEDFI